MLSSTHEGCGRHGCRATDEFLLLSAGGRRGRLGKVGPAAASALPVLKATLQAPNSYLRGQAAVAIWRISLDVDTALPALLREMTGVSEHSKWDWIVALGEMGPRAKAAVPQLTKELEQDKEPWILGHVTNAFKSIDPEAAREVGVK